MRAIAHSTRTSIRIATVLAATASLLLAVSAGFMGTAHAAGSLPAFNDSPYAGDAAVLQIDKGDLDDFDISQSGKNGNPDCDDLAVILGVTGTVDEVRFGANPPQDSSLSFGDGTTVTLTSIHTDSESGWTLYDYAVDGDLEVFAVFFKQKSGGVLFDYTPGTSTGDTGLHSLEADGVVSHISVCAVEPAASQDDDDDIIDDDDDVIDDEDDDITNDDVIDDITNDDVIDTVVMDDVQRSDDVDAGTDVDNTTGDVKVLDEVATADELPATGLETLHLALLAALLAGLGVLFLLGTETGTVRAYRA